MKPLTLTPLVAGRSTRGRGARISHCLRRRNLAVEPRYRRRRHRRLELGVGVSRLSDGCLDCVVYRLAGGGPT